MPEDGAAAAPRRGRLRRLIPWSSLIPLLLFAGSLLSVVAAVYAPSLEKSREAKPLAGGLITIQTVNGAAFGSGCVGRTYHECVVREYGEPALAPVPLTGHEFSLLFSAKFIGSVCWSDESLDKVARAQGERETRARRSGSPAHAFEFPQVPHHQGHRRSPTGRMAASLCGVREEHSLLGRIYRGGLRAGFGFPVVAPPHLSTLRQPVCRLRLRMARPEPRLRLPRVRVPLPTVSGALARLSRSGGHGVAVAIEPNVQAGGPIFTVF